MENRLGLMGKSKVAAKAEAVKMFLKVEYRINIWRQVKEHWAEFSALMAGGAEKQAEKKEFAFEESEEGESEMVVCVRVRPRLLPFFRIIICHAPINEQLTQQTNKQTMQKCENK